jgi:hypothetical protein
MSANIPPRVLRRVRLGIGLLDTFGPDDWRERIDIKRLDLADSSRCVLGQVYGGYEQGCRRLWMGEPYAFGFYEPGFFTANHFMYDQLTRAWIQELAA